MREGFGATAGVFDREPRLAVAAQIEAAENRKTHRESVVAVRLDRFPAAQVAGCDLEGVGRFDDVLAEARELAGHAGDPIGFLFAGMRDARDARRAGEKRRERGEGEKGIRKLREILRDAALHGRLREARIQATRARSDRRSHARQHVGKVRIALQPHAGRTQKR